MGEKEKIASASVTVEICVGLHCALDGAYSLLEMVQARYNLEIGRVSEDGMLLIERECVRSCSCGLLVIINGVTYSKTSFKKVIKYIDALQIQKHLYK